MSRSAVSIMFLALLVAGVAAGPLATAQAPDGPAEAESPLNETQILDECVNWPRRELPPCIPDDVPIPPELEISASEGDPFRRAYMVQAAVPESMDKLYGFYEQRAKSLGWRQVGFDRQPANDTLTLVFHKQQQQFSVSMSPGRNGTQITLNTSRIKEDQPPRNDSLR